MNLVKFHRPDKTSRVAVSVETHCLTDLSYANIQNVNKYFKG